MVTDISRAKRELFLGGGKKNTGLINDLEGGIRVKGGENYFGILGKLAQEYVGNFRG